MDFVVVLLSSIAAQTGTDPASNSIGVGTIIQTAGGVGAFGLVAWVLKRVFTHVIPEIVGQFTDSLQHQTETCKEEIRLLQERALVEHERQRQDFREELARQRDDFRSEIHREREFFGTQLVRLSEAVERLETTIREHSASHQASGNGG